MVKASGRREKSTMFQNTCDLKNIYSRAVSSSPADQMKTGAFVALVTKIYTFLNDAFDLVVFERSHYNYS